MRGTILTVPCPPRLQPRTPRLQPQHLRAATSGANNAVEYPPHLSTASAAHFTIDANQQRRVQQTSRTVQNGETSPNFSSNSP